MFFKRFGHRYCTDIEQILYGTYDLQNSNFCAKLPESACGTFLLTNLYAFDSNFTCKETIYKRNLE